MTFLPRAAFPAAVAFAFHWAARASGPAGEGGASLNPPRDAWRSDAPRVPASHPADAPAFAPVRFEWPRPPSVPLNPNPSGPSDPDAAVSSGPPPFPSLPLPDHVGPAPVRSSAANRLVRPDRAGRWAGAVDTVAGGVDSVFVLPDRFLIPGSETVTVDTSALKSGSGYSLDAAAGRIRFTRPPDSGAVVKIRYRRLPVSLPLVWRRWAASDTAVEGSAPGAALPSAAGAATRRPAAAADDFSEALQKSGSIFRGISLGTGQGLRLQSGLRLQVSGKVAANVEVTASLTDQNTPIQPEGNTQTLQEIDKVFVSLKAPRFNATLGDFQFEAPGSRFASYSRKLQGASATAEAPSGALTVFAAASKGEFATNAFTGQEGNQGPYALTGSKGQRDILVLAGTEKVWIDGEPMTRGEDNDYTIEYGTGQITFSRRRLITAASRITADFEYSDQKFQKGIYGAVGEARLWGDRARVRASLVSEADDREHPLDGTLTGETRAVLGRAGDSPDSAVTPGARFVGEGQGSYTAGDSLGVTVYRYRGRGRGDHTVRFSYVGQGRGDYSFQGYDIYRYEGQGRGAYLAVVFLPLASSHQVADAAVSLAPVSGVALEGEIGASRLDRNTYSGLDDADNAGTASAAGLRLSPRRVALFGASLGTAELDVRFRNTGERFRPLGRSAEVEHGRKWGTQEGETWGETATEGRAVLSPWKPLSLETEAGVFRKGLFRSDRRRFGLSLSGAGLPAARFDSERLATSNGPGFSGEWLRQNGSLEAAWRGLRPSVRYDGEHRRDASPDSTVTGFRFDEWTAGLALSSGAARLELSQGLRDDRVYRDSRLAADALSGTGRARLDARAGSWGTASASFTHRDRRAEGPGAESRKTDLAEARLDLSPWKGGLETHLNYKFSSTAAAEMAKDTIRIGEGLGNYRYDASLGEYVPDPDGDVLFRTLQTGRFLPVNELEGEADARFDGAKLWRRAGGLRGALSSFAARSLFRVERRDRNAGFAAVNGRAFSPDWGRDPGTLSALVSMTQDLEYTAPGRSVSARLRFRSDDSESHQLVQEGTLRRLRGRNLRIKANPSKSFGVQAEFDLQRESKRFFGTGRQDRNVLLGAGSLEASYRPRPALELALKTKARLAEDAEPDPDTRASAWFWMPRVSLNFKTRGQARTELEWGAVSAEPRGRALPYEMLGGDQPGRTVRLNLLLTYRVSGHVTGTLNYRARREPWRDRTFHSGQVEMRAFF